MKKTICLVLMVFCISFLWAEGTMIPYVSLDASSVDSFWNNCLQTRMDLGLRFSSGFGIRFPLTFISDTSISEVSMLGFGLFLDYRPLYDGFFVSVSLLERGLFFGMDKPTEQNLYLNEVAFGYTWHLFSPLFLEPRILLRDPSGVFQSEYDSISGAFPDFSSVRFSISVGWDFLAVPFPRMGGEESNRQEGESVL
jgi:hypothetical protein